MKVGEYVRTKYGIKQIYKIDNNKTVWKYFYKLKKQDGDGYIDLGCFSDSDVIKSSPNIIDLIEVGDYVNGYKVTYVANEEPCPSGKFVDIDCDKDTSDSYFFDNEIKTIVTHEQFSQMEYRIGD